MKVKQKLTISEKISQLIKNNNKDELKVFLNDQYPESTHHSRTPSEHYPDYSPKVQ